MNTAVVVGSLYGIGPLLPNQIKHALSRPFSLLIDWQFGQESSPRGFPKTYNRLINAAFADLDCRYVWILGDDVEPLAGSLEETQQEMERDPSIGAIFPVEYWPGKDGPATVMPFTGEAVQIKNVPREPSHIEQIFAGMACACIRREAWEAVGPLDETLGLGYCEDTDWGIRCWKAGWRVVNYRRAFFLHQRGATFNRLVADGVMDAKEPYRAADKLKEKWPFMWRDDAHTIMQMLRQWQEEAKERK